jgi:ribosomal protein S18 acetylase RimI-like enzyme
MANFTFRYGKESDIEELVSSAIEMCRETGEADFPRQSVREGVAKILANKERGFYLIAEADGAVAGSLNVTPQWLDLLNGCFWWIQCVYVKPSYRRRGCYSAMYAFVHELAKSDPHSRGLRLIVHPKNTAAIEAYEGLGMEVVPFTMYANNFF